MINLRQDINQNAKYVSSIYMKFSAITIGSLK